MNRLTLSLGIAAFLCALPAAAAPPSAPTPPPEAKPSQAATDLGAFSTSSTNERPWAKSVSPSEQRIATELFREGNGLLKESLFVQAAAKYREALSHWDHPGIHYNLALALLNLDQPVEVYQQLEEAMKYGHAPLDADKYDHASRYKNLIEKQLARYEIVCTEPGTVVSLDGRVLFTAPGQKEGLVRVGQHTIVGEKQGFVTANKTPLLPPGQKTVIHLKMYTADELTAYKRRWSVAMPWSILAAGIVVAGVGGILHWQASDQYGAYDRGITSCAMGNPSTGGCTPGPSISDHKSTGDALQDVAYAAYGIGGALVVTGGVLAYLNRAKPYRVNPEADTGPKVTLLPSFGRDGAGVVSIVRF
jgi:tetratricopeptide (TPR) repeat protein